MSKTSSPHPPPTQPAQDESTTDSQQRLDCPTIDPLTQVLTTSVFPLRRAHLNVGVAGGAGPRSSKI